MPESAAKNQTTARACGALPFLKAAKRPAYVLTFVFILTLTACASIPSRAADIDYQLAPQNGAPGGAF